MAETVEALLNEDLDIDFPTFEEEEEEEDMHYHRPPSERGLESATNVPPAVQHAAALASSGRSPSKADTTRCHSLPWRSRSFHAASGPASNHPFCQLQLHSHSSLSSHVTVYQDRGSAVCIAAALSHSA